MTGPPGDELQKLTWPLAEAGDALVHAARQAGLPLAAATLPRPSAAALAVPSTLLPNLAARLGLEAPRQALGAAGIGATLVAADLALLPIKDRLLVMHRGKVLAPTGRVRLAPRQLQALALAPQEAAARRQVAPFVAKLGLENDASKAATEALIEQELAEQTVYAHELRLPPTAPLPQLLRSSGLLAGLFRLLLVDLLFLLLFLLSWRALGGALMSGRGEPAQLWPWALLLATLIPLHRASRRLEATLALRAGVLVKERMLAGTLRLPPEKLQHEGSGGLLGRVLEAETLETALLGGGLSALLSAVELVGAGALLLYFGLAPVAVALLLTLVLAIALLAFAWPRLVSWTDHRLQITATLTQNMVGQRTRLAQLPPARWHLEEDQQLRHYHQLARRRDGAEWALLTLLPQGFLIAGLIGLAPAFLGDEVKTGVLAAGLGATLLAQNALRRAATALWQLADARVAYRVAEPLLAAASNAEPLAPLAGSEVTPTSGNNEAEGELVLAARELRFAWPRSELAILRGASLEVHQGERLVLTGPSGGGKSTLISVLAGLQKPQSGLLLAGGLDISTLGLEGFRRRVALAPQFHQNHIITGPLSFNLLMGHPDEESPEAQEEALKICQELGLGPLLERMPAGLGQMVGETGWQLSQGERSRVFMARALLQGARVVILDESLGALDPETFEKALDCLARRAESVILVAHP